jgi:filamentous hemagglutinin family protein
MKSFIALFVLGLLTYVSVHAEITLDGTLGTGIALEGPNYAIGAELGQQHGSNLFHSFGQFNINNNESATFSGPININNVIGRVTGGRPSNIDGLLRSTIPNADVYLINPAGMLFGPNATLDVQGSFHASTADTLRFRDGGEFNASNPQNSLLTIAPISAFGFLTDSPQPLSISGSATKTNKLSVPTGNALSLIGGDIQVTRSKLSANSGRINIAGVAGQGDVTLSPEDLILPGGAADVRLENSSVNVSGNAGGSIYIRAGQFFIDNASIDNSTRDAAAGDINVQAENLIASRGGRFGSTTVGTGQGGKIKIKVNELTEFSGEIVRSNGSVSASGINLTSRETGNAGAVDLETAKLNLKEGARISATAFKSGKGGNINIQATDSISLSGIGSQGQGSSISANTQGQTENAGKGGVIALKARDLHLADGALITTITFGTGQGGHVKINTTEGVTLSGEDYRGVTSGILTDSQGSGDGGHVELKANQLTLLNGSNIRANSSQSGQGGKISINVNDLVKLEGLDSAGYGSYIMANAQGKTVDAGNGGTIEIIAGRLQLADGAQIATSTFGPGQGGELAVKVTEKATFSGQDQSEEGFRSGLFTTSEGQTEAAGNGGTIVLVAGDLRLAENGEFSAMTYGPGVGGNINIQAQTVKLTDSTVMASSEARGDAGQVVLVIGDKLQMRDSTIETKALNADGGNMELIATSYVYLVNSRITTSVSEDFGGGGNIILNPKFVVLDGSQVFAKAKKGAGGNINLTTTGVYNFTGEAIAEIINASSEFGVDGLVTIATPDNNSDEAMFALPATIFDASALLDKPCGQRLAENLSHFIVAASEGTSNEPDDLLSSGLLLSKPAMTVSSATKNETISLYPLMALLTECKTQEK